MTSFIARLWHRIHGRQAPVSIMFIGLDNSGKTSILERLKESQWNQAGTQSQPNLPRSKAPGGATRGEPKSGDSPRKGIKDTNDGHDDDQDDHHLRNDFDEFDAVAGSTTMVRVAAVGSPGRQPSDKVRPTIGYNYEQISYKGQFVNMLDFSGQSKYRTLWQEFLNCVDGIVFVIDSSDLIRLVVVRDELETILGNPYFATLRPAPLAHDVVGSGSQQMTGLISLHQATVSNQQLQAKQITINQGKLILSPLEAMGTSSSGPVRTSATPTSSLTGNQQATRQGGHGAGVRRSGRRCKVPILMLSNKTDLSNSADTEVITRALNLDQLVNRSRHPWRMQATSVITNQGMHEGLNWLLGEINAIS